MSHATTGRCLCGGVRYEIRGTPREVIACHCSQCRQTSGHHVAMTSAANGDLVLTSSETLRWYRSSDTAERGFCSRCGGNLFWRQIGPDATTTSITAGTLDVPTKLRITKHIFYADKSDYYEVSDGVPRTPGW